MYRIQTVPELRLVDLELMQRSFGVRGEELYWKLRGLPANDKDRQVLPQGVLGGRGGFGAQAGEGLALGEVGGVWGKGKGSQISRATSLWEPSAKPSFLRGMLAYLVDRASMTLREQERRAGRLDLLLSVAGEGRPISGPLSSRKRSRSPTSLTLGRALRPRSACRLVLTSLACELLEELLARRNLVTKIGVKLSRFDHEPGQRQLTLFETTSLGMNGASGLSEAAANRLDCALDKLRKRHGFGAVIAGEASELMGDEVKGDYVKGKDGFRLRTPSLTL